MLQLLRLDYSELIYVFCEFTDYDWNHGQCAAHMEIFTQAIITFMEMRGKVVLMREYQRACKHRQRPSFETSI